jgi:CheY-like chemotaxis protein/anti-sigma regulatory factor (Ser/Thr protein kinase)
VKILVVDDHRSNRELLGFILADHGHDYTEAECGRSACDAVAADQSIDLVLMDITMPLMDGYQATEEIKAHCGDRYIPIIFITALDNDETLAKCLSVGGDDFLAKPVNENVLIAKLKAHERTLQYHKQLRHTNTQLHYHQLQMQREHVIVERILQSAIQRSDNDCSNITSRVSPMTMFNGDILLVAPSPSGGVYIILGDFTGHGLSAAIGCLPVADIFYAMTSKQASVGDIATEVNKRLHAILPSHMFFCAVIIELNNSGDRLSIWSGGINDILLVTPEGGIFDRLCGQHMPMGILDEKEFDNNVRVIKPPLGTRLYAYTDGVIETHSPTSELYGEERLEALFDWPCDNRVAQIFDSIEAFRAGESQDDDISILELLCQPVVHSDSSVLSSEASSRQMSLPWHITLQLDANHLREYEVVPQLLQVIANIQGLNVHQDLLFTILTELYNNAIEHGILRLNAAAETGAEGFSAYYQERAERLKNLTSGKLIFELAVEPGVDSEVNRLVFSFTDDGPGFNYQKLKQCNKEADELCFGRGLTLASSLCDKLQYSDSGRRVEVVYSLH